VKDIFELEWVAKGLPEKPINAGKKVGKKKPEK
jgi:hypothetical protein